MGCVVTGAGIVTSVGSNREVCFAALCDGVTGNKPLQSFDQSRFNLTRAYEIADPPAPQRDTRARATRWLCAAVDEAIKMSGLLPHQGRQAILVGTGLRELRGVELWWADRQAFEVAELNFGRALRRVTKTKGPIISISNACAASNSALGLAEDLLVLGEAEAVIVAGCDSVTESMFGLVDRTSMLGPEYVQPFDRNRRGVLLGEGAAAVVLESAERAADRGASPLALLRGVGMSCDAYHETAPDRGGILQSMIDAHQRSGVSPDEIDLLLVHGTGTALNDKTEALAIRDLFGVRAGGMIITALKSMIGHTSGASGLIGMVTAIECLNQGRVPPTIGLTMPIEEAEGLDIVVGEVRITPVQIAQVNAFGFGGVNAVAVLERAGR